MTTRYIALVLAAFVLAGCKDYEGSYSPGCIAFAGSNVRLAEGRFTWEKFTDQVIVGSDGKVVDQFPDYPKHGSYSIKGDTVYLVSDAGESMPDLHVLSLAGESYLLTAQQFESWEKTGQQDVCALMRD